jgi:hypothetical protein
LNHLREKTSLATKKSSSVNGLILFAIELREGYVAEAGVTFLTFRLIFPAKTDKSEFPFLTQRAITHSTPAGRGLPG